MKKYYSLFTYLIVGICTLALLVPGFTYVSVSAQTPLEQALVSDINEYAQKNKASFKISKLSFNGKILTLYVEGKVGDSEEFMDEVNAVVNNVFEKQGKQNDRNFEYVIFLNGKPLYENNGAKGGSKIRKNYGADFKLVLSPGHGWYYNTNSRAWVLQRSYFSGIVEDFVNHDLVTELNTKLQPNITNLYSTRELDRNAGNHTASGKPMWQMSAKDYLQSKGLPASVWDNRGGAFDTEENMAKDIRSRPLYANYLGADAMVSIHNNGGGNCGTETLYDTTNGYGKLSYELARRIQTKIIAKLRAQWNASWCDRGVKGFPGNYGENRIFEGPAALIELGFMDNSGDNAALRNATFKSLATDAIKEAILEFKNLPTTAITSPTNFSTVPVGPVQIDASATTPSGTITKVEFYVDDVKVGEDTTVPYSFTWTGIGEGARLLYTKVYNSEGGVNVSPEIRLNYGRCFADVASNNTFAPYICNLKQDGIVSGQVEDGVQYFYPTRNVTRGEMAKFVRNSFFPGVVNTSCGNFTDLQPGRSFYQEATTLKCLGIVTGSGGKFDATGTLTRGAAMKFIMNALAVRDGVSLDTSGAPNFVDVSSSHPFRTYILAAAKRGIINGQVINGKLYFRPDAAISRGEMAKVVDRSR